jgi:hypothetical protein
MGEIKTAADAAWRDFVVDGVADSGLHSPIKSEIRAVNDLIDTKVDAVVAAQGSGYIGFDTRANLFANLNYDANTLAEVVADATAAFNGVYRKSGASGAGSWTKISDNGLASLNTRMGEIEVDLDSMGDQFIDAPTTRNLYNPVTAGGEWQKAYNPGGSIATLTNYCTSGKMPVTAGAAHTFTVYYAPDAFYLPVQVLYWDVNGNWLSTVSTGLTVSEGNLGQDTIVFTPPVGAFFASFNVRMWNRDPTFEEFEGLQQRAMLTVGTKRIPFEPYRPVGTQLPVDPGRMVLVRSGGFIYMRSRWTLDFDLVNEFTLGSNEPDYTSSGVAGPYRTFKIPTGIPVADTVSALQLGGLIKFDSDDVAPYWIASVALGGNHGFPAKAVPKTGHGKTNVDIGSTWTDGAAKVWVLARVVDANSVIMAPQTSGTSPEWTLSSTLTGTTFTHQAGATNTAAITADAAITDTQLWRWVQNQSVMVFLDGEEIAADGAYFGERVDVVHSYGIPNARSVLDSLIARVGTTPDPVYNAATIQTQVQVNTTYSYRPGEMMTVAYDWFNVQAHVRGQVVGTQAGAPYLGVGGDQLFLHIPKTSVEGTSGLNFSTPQNVTANAATIQIGSAEWTDPADPPERFAFIQQTSGGTPVHGFLGGYSHLVGLGVPATRAASVAIAMEISTSEKVYPWAIEPTAAGATAAANEYNSLLAYRGYFDPVSDTNIYHQGVYRWDGKLYWVCHTKPSLTNVWVQPPYGVRGMLAGKRLNVTGNGKKSAAMTLRSSFVSDRGALITTAAGESWFIAEIAV